MRNILDCFKKNKKPFIVAELSGNHNNSLKHCFKSIEAAANCGVDAIKFQTYTADTLTIKSNRKDFFINDAESPWYKKNLYELYEKGSTPWEWHRELFNHAKKNGITAFSTPFDITSLNFLKKFNPPCYKISSFENTFHLLIKNASKTKKPLIISTGLATKKEIHEAVNVAKKNGCKKLILLKCSSNYPANPEDLNLKTILDMKKNFSCEIGFSDHTLGIGSAIMSIGFGARLIEKHFTLNKKDKTVDSKFSSDPVEMKNLVDESFKAWKSIGKKSYSFSKHEKKSLKFKRSLYFIKNLKRGDIISLNDIKAIRPGFGVASKFFNKVKGKKLKKDVLKGMPVKFNLLK